MSVEFQYVCRALRVGGTLGVPMLRRIRNYEFMLTGGGGQKGSRYALRRRPSGVESLASVRRFAWAYICCFSSETTHLMQVSHRRTG